MNAKQKLDQARKEHGAAKTAMVVAYTSATPENLTKAQKNYREALKRLADVYIQYLDDFYYS